MKLKRVFSVILMLLLGFALVACNGNDTPDPGNGGTDPGNGGTDPGNGGTDPGTDPTEIVIMHGAVNEVDPRRDDFSGREKAARIALHEEVEKELNVKIVYKPYPASAAWGPGRQDAIVNWHLANDHQADIYWITTIWMTALANNNAIAPIQSDWLRNYGRDIPETAIDASTYAGEIWGFAPEPYRGVNGLFINTALLAESGIEDPVELWNNGEWTWSKFNQWLETANTALNAREEESYVLGGVPSDYAKNLIPLNGGSLASNLTKQIAFETDTAYEVYDLLADYHSKGYFEQGGSYDSGSEAWGAGNVLLHPGTLWFVRASNRWGEFDFVKNDDIGVVPFPLPDGKTKDDYIQPVGSEAIYSLATNVEDPSKEELAFEVWTRLQLWDTKEVMDMAFEDNLGNIFGNQKHIDVMLEIYEDVYIELYESLGIPAFGADSWQINLNSAVAAGQQGVRDSIERIAPIYKAALDDYLGR